VAEIICHACASSLCGSGIYFEGEEMLIDGANTMLQIASKLLAKPKQVVKGFINQLKDADHEEGEDTRVQLGSDEYASSLE
jgi:hypothetical protein